MKRLTHSALFALRRWLKAHSVSATAAAVLLAVLVHVGLRQQSEWEGVFLKAAQHLRQGVDVYRAEDAYLYPPFTAWAAQPFTFLPPWTVRGSWLALNAVCLWLMVRWAWQVAGGGRLQGETSAGTGERIAAILGLLCGVFYLHNCLVHQQTDVILGTLLLGGCLALTRARALLAATCFGLAAAMKCTALLWTPYLIWRGRPLAAAWLVAVALGVNVLPDLTNSSPTGRPWLAVFGSRFLQPLTGADSYPGTWGSELVYNQSLSGAANRWLTTAWDWTETGCEVRPLANAASPSLVRGVVYPLELLLVALLTWAGGQPFRKSQAGKGDSFGLALECSLILLLTLLMSPMSSKAHFGVLILPGFCLARAAVASGSRLFWVLLLAAVTCALLSNKDPLGERLYTLTLWYGSVTWNVLFLLAGCCLLLWQVRREDSTLAKVEWSQVQGTARAA